MQPNNTPLCNTKQLGQSLPEPVYIGTPGELRTQARRHQLLALWHDLQHEICECEAELVEIDNQGAEHGSEQ